MKNEITGITSIAPAPTGWNMQISGKSEDGETIKKKFCVAAFATVNEEGRDFITPIVFNEQNIGRTLAEIEEELLSGGLQIEFSRLYCDSIPATTNLRR